MAEKGWKGKGDKEPRRSPRKRGKTCGRPFKAPRPVSESLERDSDVVLLTTEVDIQTDSQVQVITETENERDLRSRRRSIMLSDREVNEMVKYGEVINYGSSEDDKQTRQKTPQETIESDTTGSTPEIFKSPIQELVGTVTTDTEKARDHAKRQEGAQGELVQIMNRNARRSYASLEKAMNNWCSWKTIERFLKSNDDFKTYSQNIRPLLSEGNRLKQVSFSIHVHNRWGLAPGTKILWTMRYNPKHCFMNDTCTITYP